MLQLGAVPGQARLRLREAIAEFNEWRRCNNVRVTTVRSYDRELRVLAVYLRNPDLEEVKVHDVIGYLNLLADFGWSANGMIPKISAFKIFFRYHRRMGRTVLDDGLIPKPRKEFTMPKVADEATYRKLLAMIPEDTNDARHIRNAALIRMLWDTGARNGEVLALNLGDIDFAACKATIQTEKSRGQRPIRQIFWTEDTNKYLVRWIRAREKAAKTMAFHEPGALFVSLKRSMHDTLGKRLTIRGVGELLRRYSIRGKLPYLNAHSFRHRKAHHIINSNGSNSDVMNVLGHASLESSKIYVYMVGKELEDRARKFMPG